MQMCERKQKGMGRTSSDARNTDDLESERRRTYEHEEFEDAPSPDTERAHHGLPSRHDGKSNEEIRAMQTRSSNEQDAQFWRDNRRAAADNNDTDSSGSHSHQSRSREYTGKAAKNWLGGPTVYYMNSIWEVP